MNKQKIVALLPMKAHSERIKGKNFREFSGKPLFRWILDSLLSVSSIDMVVVNTDARDLLEKHGLVDSDRVLIRDRKPELVGDFVSMNRILRDDIIAVDSESYLMTHTTNPLLKSTTIREAVDSYLRGLSDKTCDSLFSVNKYQTRFYRGDGCAINHDPQNLIRTQDLEPWYEENSNLYLFSRESFMKTSARIGRKPMLFESPRRESVDIDDQEGWDIAEMLAFAKVNTSRE